MPFHFVVLYIIRTSLHIFHLAWKLALSGTREPIGNMRNVIKSFVFLLTFTFARADPDTLYKEGLSTRGKQNATWRHQQEAISMFARAAGFRVTSAADKELSRLQLLGGRLGGAADASAPLEGFGGSVEVLKEGHRGAIRELAKAFRDGYGVDMNQRLSVALLKRASELGDPEAQGQMGLRYSLGLQDPLSWGQDGIIGFEEADDEKAMLHFFFAAKSGDNAARMVLAYRHMYGIGVPKSCWTAATYYQPVAEQVADLSSQPDSLPLIERIRLHVQSTQGLQADRQREVVQYYQYSADKGNVEAQTAVAQVLNFGTYGIRRDHAQALKYFTSAAEHGDHEAMAHLGHMYANGHGTPRDYGIAHNWLRLATEKESASGQFGLACLYLYGHFVEEDHERAFKLFSKAAGQGHADANFYLGLMHHKGLGLRRKNAQKAFQYYALASQGGHVQAMYNAAMMQLAGKGTTKSCKPALNLLKQIAERSPQAAALQRGHEHFFRAQHMLALLDYLEAAEMGMELGQSNAAWLMHRAYVSPGGRSPNVTFSLIRRSADQGNVASLLLMADSYLNGDGVEQDWVRSAAVYYDAFQERSAQATFNLGFMHEFGVGVQKDLKLARKYYLMAKHTQPDAFLPVYIATAWLSAHELWDWALPRVPEKLRPYWERAMELHPPYTTVLGRWGAVLQSVMPSHKLLQLEAVIGHIASLLSAMIPSSLLDVSGSSDTEDASDTYLLVGMVIVLILVLRARQQRAAARATLPLQQQHGQALGQEGGGVLPPAGVGPFDGGEPPQAGGAAGQGQ